MLTETEMKHAKKFQSLIDTYGTQRMAEFMFTAGINSGNEVNKIFNWFKEIGWDKIDQVIKIDNQIINEKHEYPLKTKKKTDLNRRISNAFDLSEIRKLRIKHLPQEEIEKLLLQREKERMNGR